MILPNFLVIGAAKSATTTLVDMLRGHPQVSIPSRKEFNHFSHEDNFRRGLRHYSDRFGDVGRRPAIGEASPTYTLRHAYPACAKRIKEALGDPRLIFIGREPLRRIESQWLFDVHVKERPETSRVFAEAVETDRSLVDGSRYAWMLQPYLRTFRRDRLLLLTFEDFLERPEVVFGRCCEFLGLEVIAPPKASRSNPSGRTPAWFSRLVSNPWVRRVGSLLTPELRRRIRYSVRREVDRPSWPEDLRRRVEEFLRPDAEEYLRLAGVPVSRWEICRSPPADSVERGRQVVARAA